MQLKGRVLSNRKGTFEVLNEKNAIIQCRVSSKLRKVNHTPVAGDWILYTDNIDGTGFITELGDRKNCFLRPKVANIDCFVIIAAIASPDPILYYIDLMTIQSVLSETETIIVFNKTDLADTKILSEIYNKCGFKVFCTNANCGTGTQKLKNHIKGKTTVFSGASGVGKSSLLNVLYPKLELGVGEVSQRTQRGKNTTRSARFYLAEIGTLIADTPGFSALDITMAKEITLNDINFAFPEMIDFMCRCRYSRCTHRSEEGCAVTEAVGAGNIPESRYESYIKLYEDLKNKKDYKSGKIPAAIKQKNKSSEEPF